MGPDRETIADKINKFLNTPSITLAELDQEYQKSRKLHCGIES